MKNNNQSSRTLEIGLINFDSDLSPEHPTNIEAARQRGLEYDSRLKAYTDDEGCLIRDKYGQQLG